MAKSMMQVAQKESRHVHTTTYLESFFRRSPRTFFRFVPRTAELGVRETFPRIGASPNFLVLASSRAWLKFFSGMVGLAREQGEAERVVVVGGAE